MKCTNCNGSGTTHDSVGFGYTCSVCKGKGEVGESWEKEFGEKFVVKSNAGTGLLKYTDADLIKSFISSLLDKRDAEWREKIQRLESFSSAEQVVATKVVLSKDIDSLLNQSKQ